jgi:exopolysaccharide biosynthesis polyprenyl glycosylphosphotransferase
LGLAAHLHEVCGRTGLAQDLTVPEPTQVGRASRLPARGLTMWTGAYLRRVALADASCALAAGMLAFQVRFGDVHGSAAYFWVGMSLPVCWLIALALGGAYDARFIGVGSDEFRRVVNAGICLTAAIAFVSYATKTDIARGYVIVALPSAVLFDLVTRYVVRKRLHKRRARGDCMRRAVLVGHTDVIAGLTAMLRRDTHHGLLAVAACVLGPDRPPMIEGLPVVGGLSQVLQVVQRMQADTVAVLACPEMSGARLRDLAWALERTATDLCVAPALLDVAGPRTTIRPIAGLPLLHMDHPEFTGFRWLIKSAFDRAAAAAALIALLPLLAAVALAIKIGDNGPVLFRQIRVGKDGKPFTLYKFRTMVVDAEQRLAELLAQNECDGALFKIRRDPRVTRVGDWLRRRSLDELPQLMNVLIGEMSLVGPRPALPSEADVYSHHVRRRLAVKPGITGLWQVSGRSDLPWDEAVRLDVRYVENWSFVLDLQILWKTWSAVTHGDGAYLAGRRASYSCAIKSRTGEVRKRRVQTTGGIHERAARHVERSRRAVTHAVCARWAGYCRA